MRIMNRFTSKLLFSLVVALLISAPVFADIAVIVNPANPVATLSEDDVRRIFMGRMRLFPDSNESVEALDQEEESAAFGDFYQAIARLTPAKLKRQRASYLFSGKGRLPTTLKDDAAVLEYVASHPGAIGYVTQEKLDTRVKTVMVMKP